MRTMLAILIALTCSAASAGKVGFEPWFNDPSLGPPPPPRYEDPQFPWPPRTSPMPRPRPICEPQRGHYEWQQRVLRTYWVRLPCGRLEQWEDVLHYRVWIY